MVKVKFNKEEDVLDEELLDEEDVNTDDVDDIDEEYEYDEEDENDKVSRIPKPVLIIIGVLTVLMIGFMVTFLMPKPVAPQVSSETTTLSTTVPVTTTVATTTVSETTTRLETSSQVETTTQTQVQPEVNTSSVLNRFVASVGRGEVVTPLGNVMNDAIRAGYSVISQNVNGSDVRIVMGKGDNTIEFLGTYDNGKIILTDRKGFIVQD